MKIVVIGGTGLIGSRLVDKLREQGHEAVPAAPNTGVNTLSGRASQKHQRRKRAARKLVESDRGALTR